MINLYSFTSISEFFYQRMYEQQRDQLANQQFNVDQTSFAISTVKDTQTTVAAMSAASKTLKKEAKKIKLSEIEDMQDEMEGKKTTKYLLVYTHITSFCLIDMLEDVGEISEILGRSYGMPDGIEEEDLDAELACLEDEWASEEISTANETEIASSDPMYSLPNQPNQAIVSPTSETVPSNPATAPPVSTTSYL